MNSDPKPSPFQSVIGLGALQTEFKQKGSRWFNVGCGALFALGGAALVPGSLLVFLLGGRSDQEFIPLMLCGAALALPLGVWALFESWRNWNLAAALYEGGFAVVGRNGVQQVAWNDITAVWQSITKHYRNGIYTGTTHVYTIATKDNQKFVLDDKLAKVEDLGGAIQKAVSNTLWPSYVAGLNNGQRLTFGPLALDRDGLYSGKKTITWKEIKAIKLQQGVISVKKEGGWFNWASVTVPQVPNFFIFYELISRLTKVE